MGVDVVGNNWWWWRPLAGYICEVAPEIASACEHWQSNDRDGLDGTACVALADRIQTEIDSGRTLSYARRYMSEIEAMSNEPCYLCGGTGEVATGIRCNGCGGEGYVRPSAAHYPFTVECVQEFIDFLRACGGFRIG
jgi:hypothetical protein